MVFACYGFILEIIYIYILYLEIQLDEIFANMVLAGCFRVIRQKMLTSKKKYSFAITHDQLLPPHPFFLFFTGSNGSLLGSLPRLGPQFHLQSSHQDFHFDANPVKDSVTYRSTAETSSDP